MPQQQIDFKPEEESKVEVIEDKKKAKKAKASGL